MSMATKLGGLARSHDKLKSYIHMSVATELGRVAIYKEELFSHKVTRPFDSTVLQGHVKY